MTALLHEAEMCVAQINVDSRPGADNVYGRDLLLLIRSELGSKSCLSKRDFLYFALPLFPQFNLLRPSILDYLSYRNIP
jgi:hypothetical protein